jgi:hypothetical protein
VITDNPLLFQSNTGDFTVSAQCQLLGQDIMVTVWGGDPHIGAVAMAQPRPSLKESDTISATASVFCYVGHKDDLVAKMMAEKIAAELNTKVVVAAGLHWDDLTTSGIKQVITNIDKLIMQITNGLENLDQD